MDQADSAPPQPPRSDVSAMVGVAGLAGLFTWVAIARNWPDITLWLGLPGPYEPLSGPSASVMALVFSALPMVAWSLWVEKVHLRPSTGIVWDSPRPLASVLHVSITKLAGLWATFAVIGAAYCIMRYYWDGNYLFAMKMIGWAAVPVVLLSIPYVLWLDRVLVEPRDHCWHFGAMLIGREPYDPHEVLHHARAWAVKGFFTAFMISILPGGWHYIVTRDLADAVSGPVPFAWFLIEVGFLVDVQIAMVGYLLTIRPLDSHIRSANPYLGGWVAALICYPPFLLMSGGPLDYHPNTADWGVWLEGNTALLWMWGMMLVALTWIYSWATVAFGLRFSNLTYRGVLTNGPYRFTRHPAYLAKNAFWWLATLPMLSTTGSPVDAIRNTVLLALVSTVYFWRAKTEERHLLAEDAKYREYHAWMQEHGLITSRLARVMRLVRPRGPVLQPAE